MTELLDCEVPLRDLWDARRATPLVEALRAATGSCAALAALEAAARAECDPSNHAFAVEVVRIVEQKAPGDAFIPMLLKSFGTSERTLRRRCDEIFGYGPRTLARILRLQRLLILLRGGSGESLATVAIAAGYSDQSHMTREVRALTTLSPHRLRQNT